jgi:hypothetical protein
MSSPSRINWPNAITVGSAAILIATELVAMAFAGGWAIANLFGWGAYGGYLLQAAFLLPSLYGIYAFVRAANRAEPVVQRG